VRPLVSAIGLCHHGDEGVDEFLRGCVPFVGAEEATQFQAGGTVRAGQEYGRVASGVPFPDDCGDDRNRRTCVAQPGPPQPGLLPVC
jgi:hypothetical protein